MARAKIGEERIFTIPLRRETEKVPKYMRTQKAVKAVKKFIARHMKCENICIGKYLNSKIWERGKKTPPVRIQVKAVKTEEENKKGKKEEVVKVEVVGAPEEKKEEEKKKKTLFSRKEKPSESVKEIGHEGEKEEKEEEEKKEILEHAKMEKHPVESGGRFGKEYQLKSQKLKKSKVIGSTGKK
jgi:large subunit ribosomal protein L31e